MTSSSEGKLEAEELYQRFKELLMGMQLSDDEKRSLANEILKVLYASGEEAVQC